MDEVQNRRPGGKHNFLRTTLPQQREAYYMSCVFLRPDCQVPRLCAGPRCSRATNSTTPQQSRERSANISRRRFRVPHADVFLPLFVFIRTNCLFIAEREVFFLVRPSVIFLTLLAAGRVRGPTRTLRRKCGPPAGLCGACSGRSESLKLASSHGILFRRARAKQGHGNSTVSVVRFAAAAAAAAAASHRPSSSRALLLCGSHGTTAVAHQALRFVAATGWCFFCVYRVGRP